MLFLMYDLLPKLLTSIEIRSTLEHDDMRVYFRTRDLLDYKK